MNWRFGSCAFALFIALGAELPGQANAQDNGFLAEGTQSFWTHPSIALHFGLSDQAQTFGAAAFQRPMAAGETAVPATARRAPEAGISATRFTMLSPRIVGGLELSLFRDAGDAVPAGIAPGPVGVTVTLDRGRSYGLAARLGYLLTPATQVYALAGPTWGEADASVRIVTDGDPRSTTRNSLTLSGVSVAIGFESRIGQAATLGVEWRHTSFGQTTALHGTAGAGSPADVSVGAAESALRLVLTRRF